MTDRKKMQAIRIGEIVKGARTLHKIKQKDLALAVGMSQSGISKLEAGFLLPSIVLWLDLCKFLKLNPACFRTDPPNIDDQMHYD